MTINVIIVELPTPTTSVPWTGLYTTTITSNIVSTDSDGSTYTIPAVVIKTPTASSSANTTSSKSSSPTFNNWNSTVCNTCLPVSTEDASGSVSLSSSSLASSAELMSTDLVTAAPVIATSVVYFDPTYYSPTQSNNFVSSARKPKLTSSSGSSSPAATSAAKQDNNNSSTELPASLTATSLSYSYPALSTDNLLSTYNKNMGVRIKVGNGILMAF